MKPLQIVLLITVITIAAIVILWFGKKIDEEDNRLKDYKLEVTYLNGYKDTITINGYVHHPPYLSDGCIHTGFVSAARCYVTGFKFIEK